MKSIMQHRFSETPRIEIPRSSFNRSHGYKTSFDAGYLIPFFIDEALPGDTFKVNVTGFARLSTPKYPIMDNMILDTFFFSVPYRQIWSNFRKFMGEQVDPGDSIDYTVPVIDDFNNVSNETLYDYFGLPTKIAANIEVSALPFRAYNHIYNEWFRDQNLIDSVVVDLDDGPDDAADYVLLRRCKKHDYFTSALPWLQKGDAVELSLGTSAPVFGDNMDFDNADDSGNKVQVLNGIGGSLKGIKTDTSSAYGSDAALGAGQLMTDLQNATASTVNELREAIQVQRLLERDARSGTRYAEIVQSHFGVTFPDLAYRPEYLGGGSTPVNISPIAETAAGSAGKLGAMGTIGFKNHGFVKSFTEHCVVIGLMNVRADLTYQEGIEKMWLRSTRYDFYWPTLSHLGEQAILNKEIYVDAGTIGVSDDDVFGYQERYAEYRYKNSKITGKLRSNDAATLDSWHLGIEFGAEPTLDDTFIVDNPPIDRVIVTPTEPHFIFDSYINMECIRPMPMYSVPGMIDHF